VEDKRSGIEKQNHVAFPQEAEEKAVVTSL
jgi:hypothetical protein